MANCPINERTGDGHLVGRCWHSIKDGKCPRHGDVSAALELFNATGRLTPEKWPPKQEYVPAEFLDALNKNIDDVLA